MAWRDQDTLQLGIDPRRAVALTGLGRAAAVLGLLDGSRDHAQVLAAAQERGIPRDAADQVIALLAAAGVVEDFPAAARARCRMARGPGWPVSWRPRRSPTATPMAGPASSVAGRRPGSGSTGRDRSARRWRACSPPQGSARSPRSARPAPDAWRRGRPVPRGGTNGRSARRPRPGARYPAAEAGQRADLAILAGGYPAELPGELAASGTAHLAASASEAIGVVGPLVIPGRSACLGCLELARRDRDPAWPLILAQVAGRSASPAACGAALAAAVAAQAAGQALSFIDLARPADAVINGTLELVLPGWQWRRRSWAPHPRCRCSRRPGTQPRM